MEPDWHHRHRHPQGLAFTQTYAASVNPVASPHTWSFTTRQGARLYLPVVVRYHGREVERTEAALAPNTGPPAADY
jgi:hypothetical protein